VKYVLLIFLGFLLVVIQTMISSLLFHGKLVLEMSLIMVIYAGFTLSVMRGGVFSFILGFFLDCFMGSLSGLFAFSYVIFFLISKFISLRMYAESVHFIVIIVGLYALLEGIIVMTFYKLAYGVDKFYHLWDVFLPQALLLAMLGPFIFKLLKKLEVLPNGGNTRPVERPAIR
jgi:rod shape-determining protein MreD